MNTANTPLLKSFVPVGAESHFPIQNLPYGVFRTSSDASPRVGVAIGEYVLDLALLEQRGLLKVAETPQAIFGRGSLNSFLALGRTAWRAARARITELLREDAPELRDNVELRSQAIIPINLVSMLLPVETPDYTDFYSSRHHATNVGTMLRGAEHALQENWPHLPVAYHGRASSLVVSGADVRRPVGQLGLGKFGASGAVDFELEMGFFVGPGNALGEPIHIAQTPDHIFGMVLVNDWSARDIQKWEYVPLGPFLSKSFATSISPWVVPLDALAPFRAPLPPQDPQPLEYLRWADDHLFDIQLEVSLSTRRSNETTRLTRSNFQHLYWSIHQQLAHHTVAGCNTRPGDLLASGTISGPEKESRGCLLELTWRGAEPIELPNGERRTFLDDDDQITMTGWCQGDGYRVGFGDVTSRILPARTS
jgi:fumarylacetoacetase